MWDRPALGHSAPRFQKTASALFLDLTTAGLPVPLAQHLSMTLNGVLSAPEWPLLPLTAQG